MDDTSGFYTVANGALMHAPNFVDSPDFLLTRETRVEFSEAGGWYWFDSEYEASNWFGFFDESYWASE